MDVAEGKSQPREQPASKELLLQRAKRNAAETRAIIRENRIIHPTVELAEFFDAVIRELEGTAHEPCPAAKEWRCFHCDDVFRAPVDARNHFGGSESSEPACLIKAPGEFALLQAFRNAEDELGRYRNEDSDVLRVLWSTRADHAEALRREEEKGYARALEDAKEHPETLGLQRASQPPPVGRSITISGYALKAALEFVAPDMDADQLETEVSIQYGDASVGHSGAGYYCCLSEYPEEGSILLPEDVEPSSTATKCEDLPECRCKRSDGSTRFNINCVIHGKAP
jgi:hypothetical protein